MQERGGASARAEVGFTGLCMRPGEKRDGVCRFGAGIHAINKQPQGRNVILGSSKVAGRRKSLKSSVQKCNQKPGS